MTFQYKEILFEDLLGLYQFLLLHYDKIDDVIKTLNQQEGFQEWLKMQSDVK